MKKIRIILIVSFISLIAFMPNALAASSFISKYNGVNNSYSIKWSEKGKKTTAQPYHDSILTVNVNGKPYDAYCIDPNLKMSSGMNLTCSPSTSSGLSYLLNHLTGDHTVDHLAIRFYSVMDPSVAKDAGTLTNLKAAITRYFQLKQGIGVDDIYKDCGAGSVPSDFLFGNDAVINRAYNLAWESFSNNYNSGSNSSTNTTGGLNIGPKVVKGLTATYSISSSSKINKNDLKFTCENCTINSINWNGTSGTLKIIAKECGEEYKIGVNSSLGNGAYICSINNSAFQNLVIDLDDSNSNSDMISYHPDKIPCDGDPDCCTDDPITPGWIEGDINNCCEDNTTSEAHEYNLDKLFCKDAKLDVDYYKPKCQSDYYYDDTTGLNAKYCKMYCTERVSVEIPGAITATSGRYFTLTSFKKGNKEIKSPYIEGFRRCRIRVQYDVWESDYGKEVDKQISAYNDYQKNEAYRLMYNDAITNHKIANQSETSKISCSASCTISWSTTDANGNPSTDSEKKSDSITVVCTINYDKYEFKKMYNYYGVKVDKTKRDNYTAYQILNDTAKNGTTSHREWSAWNIDSSISSCNKMVSSMQTTYSASNSYGSCSATYKCSRTQTTAEKNREDVYSVRSSYQDKVTSAENSYNAATSAAKQLEDDLDKCDNYFTKYKGANAKESYTFDPSMNFYYTQVYMDDSGKLVLDKQNVNFGEKPICNITGPTAGPDGADNLAGKRYSSKYSKNGNTEVLIDFSSDPNKKIIYKDKIDGFKDLFDTTYNADKVFTHDAKYHATCYWEESEDNKYNTLVPSGAAKKETSKNYTAHGQEYYAFLTTLEGSYETHWQLSGLGSRIKNSSKGKFDDYFLTHGATCANENHSDSSMLTCTLKVQHEVILTGKCNPSNGSFATVYTDDCEPYKEGYELFEFKVVDPKDIFPVGTSSSSGNYAWNWVNGDAKGIDLKNNETKATEVLKDIRKIAEKDETFAPEYLSYSYTLTSTDMAHIKNYNKSKNADGGYLDFNLKCSCPTSEKYSGPCTKCKSTFLEELANNNISYDNQKHKVTGWSNNNKDISAVRKSYGW